MSQLPQSAQPSAQAGPPISFEILNTLAEKLQEISQAILALGPTAPSEPATSPAEATPEAPKEPEQIRCYRVPGFIVRDEREALNVHQAKDLLDFLRKAREDFDLTAFLLRNFTDCEYVSGEILRQIGEQLDRPVRMLTWLCSIFADYKQQMPETSPDC